MGTDTLFQLVGGLGFFFLGMKTMSDGLKRVAGEKLKQFLHKVTKNRFYGVFIGALATVFVQSSSVTTVFVVGFVNAALINLSQAIPLILGANIGTTFTAWLVSSMSIFKISKYALPAVGIGFALNAFGKGRRKNVGLVLLGFGILFTGLDYMKDAFAPLKDTPLIHDTFLTFSQHPILGVIAGIVFTVLLQSSSATIAIVQVMAFNGLISLDAAIPIILGDNIGTTITAQMAAIGGNINARRAAMSHTIFNTLGTAYILVFVYLGFYTNIVKAIVPGELSSVNIMFHIAVAHSVFNVMNTLIFLPFVSVLEKVSVMLVPKKADTIDFETQYLEDHLLDSPNLALEQIHKEIGYMLKISQKAVNHAVSAFFELNAGKAKKANELEAVTDSLQHQITQYMVKLSQKKLMMDESVELPILIHHVNDLERIGDHANNLAELTKRRMENKLQFTDEALAELKEMSEEINKMFDEAHQTFLNADKISAARVMMYEKNVDQLEKRFKQNHVERLNKDVCKMDAGFVFLEFVYNFEKIGDRLSNIGKAVLQTAEESEE